MPGDVVIREHAVAVVAAAAGRAVMVRLADGNDLKVPHYTPPTWELVYVGVQGIHVRGSDGHLAWWSDGPTRTALADLRFDGYVPRARL